MLHCACGSEWIAPIRLHDDSFNPVLCANCGKAGEVDGSVAPCYVRGVVLDADSKPADEETERVQDTKGA